jgi:RNA polymerase sigma-70 factor (ECF subfamily)
VTAARLNRSPDGVRTRPETDIASLVELARAGEAPAWEQLYRLFYPRLLAFAARQIGADRAADAVSETMVRAVANIERFSWRGAGFESWLFAILRNVIVDGHRRERRWAQLAPVPEGDSPEPDEGLAADEDARQVRAGFARLRPEDQELLYLRVVLGLPSEDVATILGKRPGAVRMAQSRALDRLRDLLRSQQP